MPNPTMPLPKLNAAGQSVWYNHIHRDMITTGGLAALIIRTACCPRLRSACVSPSRKVRRSVRGVSLAWAVRLMGMRTFGASALLKKMQKRFGFNTDNIVSVVKQQLAAKA